VWGAFHALGLIAYDLYRPWATRRRLKRGPKVPPLRNHVGRVVAIATTFAFVSIGWIPFALPLQAMRRIFGW
jgi:D-alanyl-lipoteichoic acid acyltransferase DltB (MBOAT superfamily)